MRLVCEIDGCGEDLTEGTGSKGGLMICPRCRQSSYYWRKQSNDAIKARKQALSFWTSRIEYFSPYVRKLMNQAQRKVAAATKHAQARLN